LGIEEIQLLSTIVYCQDIHIFSALGEMQFGGGWFKNYLPPDYANWAIAYVCVWWWWWWCRGGGMAAIEVSMINLVALHELHSMFAHSEQTEQTQGSCTYAEHAGDLADC
jgi:hypothetical protein